MKAGANGLVDEFQLKFVVAIGVVLLISFIALGASAGVIVALSVKREARWAPCGHGPRGRRRRAPRRSG